MTAPSEPLPPLIPPVPGDAAPAVWRALGTTPVPAAEVAVQTVPIPPEPAFPPPEPLLPPSVVPGPGARPPASQIQIPPGLPGADAKFPRLPPDGTATRGSRRKAVDALFPKLAPLGPDPLVDPAPGCEAATLDGLIDFARKNSPLLVQAAADVEVYRGRTVQAGLYPNPTVGFQGDQIGDGGPFGQFGSFINQTIPLNGRLRLARAVAHFDYLNAKVRLRRAEIDLARRVRNDYYAVLVAAEAVRVNRLVGEFTEEVYRRQVANVRGGQSAAFEANALRAVVGQVRANVVHSRNRYVSAWKQLAATLNAPEMPPTPLAERVDAAVPRYAFDALQRRMLECHTDLAIAKNSVAQAEQTLTLERRRPIPDAQNNFYFEDDTLVKSFQFGAQVGFTIPIFNKNQGAIAAARAEIVRLSRETERVRNDLVRTLAEAFERYETGRQQLALYRDYILPDLAVAFRGVYERYQVEPEKVNYNDIVTAQQNFAAQLGNYLQALQNQWQAVADLTAAVQANDPYELSSGLEPGLPDGWPAALPGK